jgi:hypothetical protein
MPFAEDLSPFFAPGGFGDAVVVGGVAVNAIFDIESQVVLGELITIAPTLLMATTAAPSAAAGTDCVIRGQNYSVRQVLVEPPDGALKRLVLAKV